jgi:hypothetical protein
MRRLTLLLLAVGMAACKRSTPAPVVIEEPSGLLQTLEMGNLEHAKQLGKGFYAVEDGAWRWTQGKFSVMLRSPIQAGAKGATLVVKATIPQPIIEKLKDVTLTCVVNGVRLKTTNYNRPGAVVLRLDVPPKAFPTENVAVDFVLDKVLPPRPDDQRELGLILTSIGFERKT